MVRSPRLVASRLGGLRRASLPSRRRAEAHGLGAIELLNGLGAIGAPCLGLGGESTVRALEGTQASALMTRQALHGQLLNELLERDADLLCHGGLHGDLLRQLSEHQDDLLCRMVCARVRTRHERILQERTLQERTLQERTLQERSRIHACQCGLVSERHEARVCAGLSERARTHLRPPRPLQSRKLRYESLRGIL